MPRSGAASRDSPPCGQVAPPDGAGGLRREDSSVLMENDGLLEHAQQMAAHASARTAKLYDRRGEAIPLDGVERIVL